MNEDWKPTARLRLIKRDNRSAEQRERHEKEGVAYFYQPTLQQWYAPDVPSYMRTQSDGEWRDVLVEEETAP